MRRIDDAEWRKQQLWAGGVITLVLLLIEFLFSHAVPLPIT